MENKIITNAELENMKNAKPNPKMGTYGMGYTDAIIEMSKQHLASNQAIIEEIDKLRFFILNYARIPRENLKEIDDKLIGFRKKILGGNN